MKKILLLLLTCLTLVCTAFAKQWIIFHAEKVSINAPFGHAFASFIQEDIFQKQTKIVGRWGFYPSKRSAKALWATVPGELKDDFDTKIDYSFMVEVSIDEFNHCLRIKDLYKKELEYSLKGQSCVNFVRDLSNAITSLEPASPSLAFPADVVKDLKIKNKQIEEESIKSLSNSIGNITNSPVEAPTTNPQPEGILSTGATLLFTGDLTYYHTDLQLSSSEKEQVYKLLNLQLSKDKTKLHDKGDKEFAYPLDLSVDIIDLNNDKRLEVFVFLYDLHWTGQAGQTIAFGKNSAGNFTEILNAHGSAEVLQTMTAGYPDLIIGGPGLTAPVVTWNGIKYQFYKNVSFAAGKAPKMMTFAEFYSKQKNK